MSYSARHLSYKGYFTYVKGRSSSNFYLVHWADGQQEKQRLVFQDGPAYELISDGHSLKCLHSGDLSEQSHADGLSANPLPSLGVDQASLWANYDAQMLGASRIANRQVLRVQLNPKDIFRYPYQFDIDEKTGLMLKMAVLTLQGETVETFHFSSISYDAVKEADLLPQFEHVKVVEHAVDAHANVPNPESYRWQLTWVPSGFGQDNHAINPWARKAAGQQVFLYGDGLSTFSVFIEPVEKRVIVDASTQNGSTSAYMHYLEVSGQLYLITVVGEVPLQTVKKIALSVKLSS